MRIKKSDENAATSVIGRRLKRWREMRKLSLRELGEAASLGHQTLSKIERGDAMFSMESLFRVASVLSIPPSMLIDVSVDAAAVIGEIDADAWHPGEPFFAPDKMYPLPVPHHPDVTTGEAFRFNGAWLICERLEMVGKDLEEGAACVVWRQPRGKGSNLSFRIYTSSDNPGPPLTEAHALAAALRRLDASEANFPADAGYLQPREDGAFYTALGKKLGRVPEAETDRVARTGWLVAADGDPAARYLRASDYSIKRIWLVCSQFSHVR